MLKIEKVNGYNICLNFILEFAEYVKNSNVEDKNAKNNFDFDDFMTSMYGGLKEFKEKYLEQFSEYYNATIHYLDRYEEISNIVEKVEE